MLLRLQTAEITTSRGIARFTRRHCIENFFLSNIIKIFRRYPVWNTNWSISKLVPFFWFTSIAVLKTIFTFILLHQVLNQSGPCTSSLPGRVAVCIVENLVTMIFFGLFLAWELVPWNKHPLIQKLTSCTLHHPINSCSLQLFRELSTSKDFEWAAENTYCSRKPLPKNRCVHNHIIEAPVRTRISQSPTNRPFTWNRTLCCTCLSLTPRWKGRKGSKGAVGSVSKVSQILELLVDLSFISISNTSFCSRVPPDVRALLSNFVRPRSIQCPPVDFKHPQDHSIDHPPLDYIMHTIWRLLACHMLP